MKHWVKSDSLKQLKADMNLSILRSTCWLTRARKPHHIWKECITVITLCWYSEPQQAAMPSLPSHPPWGVLALLKQSSVALMLWFCMVLFLYSTFLVLMTTQSSLQYSFTFTHSYSASMSSTLLFYEGQLMVQHLAQGPSACRWGRLGIELPTFRLENDRSTPQPQPPLMSCALIIPSALSKCFWSVHSSVFLSVGLWAPTCTSPNHIITHPALFSQGIRIYNTRVKCQL